MKDDPSDTIPPASCPPTIPAPPPSMRERQTMLPPAMYDPAVRVLGWALSETGDVVPAIEPR